ncbi:MAG TPA: amidohydrolase family protein [Acidimicrobiales bacterium]|nr:amidohydrolase family protein [Acidimicrobiales bacterium]
MTPAEADLPPIISVDDHIIEPRDLWLRELPASMRERGPHVVRERVRLDFKGGKLLLERDAPDGKWCDLWCFEELVTPTMLLHAAAGIESEHGADVPAVYDDFRPAAYDQAERLRDMDTNHVEVSICYPNTFPRFAGQGFAERTDRDLGLASLELYNDWMIEEWCGGAGRGRLVPLTLVPLWDPDLAAAEVRRCAAKGSYAIAFTENPAKLGFPSLHSGKWDPLWEACTETGTVVSMHIGSSSVMPTTSDDAPLAVSMSLNAQNAQGSVCDWVFSRTLERFPEIKLAYAESQAGWMPFLFERMDGVWHEGVGGVELPNPPSSYAKGRIYGCIFDDEHALRSRDEIGMQHLLFESDYPHANGTWPRTRAVAHRLCEAAGMDAVDCARLLRRNAVECYGLERFGIAA